MNQSFVSVYVLRFLILDNAVKWNSFYLNSSVLTEMVLSKTYIYQIVELFHVPQD